MTTASSIRPSTIALAFRPTPSAARWRGGCSRRALETPGGLKVQTIHAFCTQLLHQFPFEADVAARFSVLDEAEQSELLERLTLNVLLDGARSPGSNLARALDTAMTAAADQTFRDVVREAIGRRDAVDALGRTVRAASRRPLQICRNCSASIGRTASRRSTPPTFRVKSSRRRNGRRSPQALASGRKTDHEQSERFRRLASLSGSERIETYLDIFCTSVSSGRTPRASVVTNAIDDAALIKHLAAERQRVYLLLQRRRAVFSRDRSAALATVAHEVLSRYRVEKERRGLLDYDDLIDKALALLSDFSAAWVHYKLDLGIDHVLVDEAQDTSHKQWDIVRWLTAEFTAGAGARRVTRTMFGSERKAIDLFFPASRTQGIRQYAAPFSKARTTRAA